MLGPATITCSNSSWSPFPVFLANCAQPSTIPTGAAHNNCNKTLTGDGGRGAASGRCTLLETGNHKLYNGSLTIVCTDGQLSPMPVLYRTCAKPVLPVGALNGTCTNTTIATGKSCQLAVDPNYTLWIGSLRIDCWDGVSSPLPTFARNCNIRVPWGAALGSCTPILPGLQMHGADPSNTCALQAAEGFTYHSGPQSLTCSNGTLTSYPRFVKNCQLEAPATGVDPGSCNISVALNGNGGSCLYAMKPGFELQPDSSLNTMCNNGTLSAHPLMKNCTAGYACAGGLSSPELCPTVTIIGAALWCPSGTIAATRLCPAGSICITPAESAPCPPGKLCLEGTRIPVPCPAGHVCAGQTGSLIPCVQGAWCPEGSNNTLTDCPAGSVCATPAAKEPCPEKFYCPARTLAPHPCPAGSFCGNSTAEPALCPMGFACPQQSSVPIACALNDSPNAVYCPAAEPNAPLLCLVGSYCSDPWTLMVCPVGNFCQAGSRAPTECPLGYKCPAKSANKIQCTDLGTYCPPGTGADPPQCPSTFFCTQPNTLQDCPAAHFCKEGSAAPALCPPGSYCPLKFAHPNICPIGSVCQAGSEQPTACTEGTYCGHEGLFEAKQCQAGFYCSTPTEELPCPSGSYCPAGSTLVKPCPAGSYCSSPDAAMLICPLGSACGLSTVQPSSCKEGYFTDTPGASECIKCAPGTIWASPDQRCADCGSAGCDGTSQW